MSNRNSVIALGIMQSDVTLTGSFDIHQSIIDPNKKGTLDLGSLLIDFCRPVGKCITKILGIDWEVRNGEKLKHQKTGIIVANHQSVLDSLGIIQISNFLEKCYINVNNNIFQLWPIGIAVWFLRNALSDKKNGNQSNKKSALTNNTSNKSEHLKILVFPEGVWSIKSNTLSPFEIEAFKMAIDMQIPIIPVVYSPYYFIKPHYHFYSGEMVISILDPIPTDGLTKKDIEVLCKVTNQIMDIEYQKLRQETKSKINDDE